MQEAVGKGGSGKDEDWNSWMEEEGRLVGEEVSSGEGEGMGVKDEVGRELDGGGQYEVGRLSPEVGTRSSLELGRSSLARSKSCQGSPGMASCYMAWLSLECRDWSGSLSAYKD